MNDVAQCPHLTLKPTSSHRIRRYARPTSPPRRRSIQTTVGLLCTIAAPTALASEIDHQARAHIAVAANFSATMEALEIAFEEKSGHELVVSSGATGALYAQIKHGAPYDIFLAADNVRPQRLIDEGAAIPGASFTYAIGQLALWAPREETITFATLCSAGRKTRLALAKPALAPYGAAAEQALAAMAVTEQRGPKRIYAANVGQAFAIAASGGADFALISYAQILTRPQRMKGAWTPAPQRLYQPIYQEAVLLNTGADNAAARAFFNYLQSPAASDIITQAGYLRTDKNIGDKPPHNTDDIDQPTENAIAGLCAHASSPPPTPTKTQP